MHWSCRAPAGPFARHRAIHWSPPARHQPGPATDWPSTVHRESPARCSLARPSGQAHSTQAWRIVRDEDAEKQYRVGCAWVLLQANGRVPSAGLAYQTPSGRVHRASATMRKSWRALSSIFRYISRSGCASTRCSTATRSCSETTPTRPFARRSPISATARPRRRSSTSCAAMRAAFASPTPSPAWRSNSFPCGARMSSRCSSNSLRPARANSWARPRITRWRSSSVAKSSASRSRCTTSRFASTSIRRRRSSATPNSTIPTMSPRTSQRSADTKPSSAKASIACWASARRTICTFRRASRNTAAT